MDGLVKTSLSLETMKQFGGAGGGCVCQGQGYHSDLGDIYVKYCANKTRGECDVIFTGEHASLSALYETDTVKVPKPIKVCKDESTVCLVTEYLEIGGLRKNKELGSKLADLHLHNSRQKDNTSSIHMKNRGYVDKFGFDVPTCCGVIPQPNEWTQNWAQFFSEQKLKVQVDMIMTKTGDRTLKELWPQALRRIPEMLSFDVEPALLHGDLWSGNAGQVGAEPVIFDPASFYGHSEFDLSIAMMFGGFGSAFFNAYFEKCPKMPGFEKRNDLYTLFHYLNHWNHFGSGYGAKSLSLMKSLIG